MSAWRVGERVVSGAADHWLHATRVQLLLTVPGSSSVSLNSKAGAFLSSVIDAGLWAREEALGGAIRTLRPLPLGVSPPGKRTPELDMAGVGEARRTLTMYVT